MNIGILFGIALNVLLLHEGQSTDYDECSDYLISGPRGISDDKLTASSTYPKEEKHHYDPKYSRLYFNKTGNINYGGWSAETNYQQYIQAEFSKLTIVKSILTQGGVHYPEWVKSYSVSYSIDGLLWSTVKDVNENTTVYAANSDLSTVVTNTLQNGLEAKYIRLHPKTWETHVTLRFDLIGCSKFDKKIARYEMNWKRHSISLTPEVQQNLAQVFKTATNDINVCAMKCQQTSLCLSFTLNQGLGTCTGFQEQIYQGERTDFLSQGDDAYFISLSHLKDNEYEISESLNLCYKIFTYRTTADSASNICKEGGARLLSIYNFEQMNAVQNSIKSSTILSHQPYFYVEGSYQNGMWRYATNTNIPTGLWSQSHPVSVDGCVILTLTGLKTHDCMDSLYFICGM